MSNFTANGLNNMFKEIYGEWKIDENLVREIEWHIFLLTGKTIERKILEGYLQGKSEDILAFEELLTVEQLKEVTGNAPICDFRDFDLSSLVFKEINVTKMVNLFNKNAKSKNAKLSSYPVLVSAPMQNAKARGKGKLHNHNTRRRK